MKMHRSDIHCCCILCFPSCCADATKGKSSTALWQDGIDAGT